MKFAKNILVAATLLAAALSTSCGSFDELNTDPTKLSEANPGVFINPVIYNLAISNFDRYYDFAAPVCQNDVQSITSNGIGWWVFTDNAGEGTWNSYYGILANIEEMYNLAVELDSPNYIAVAQTLKCYIYHSLVDAFGDVPMSEACKATEGITQPKFDTQSEIYTNLIQMLDDANSTYDTTTGLEYNSTAELLYSTNVSSTEGIKKWQKFTNSLRMRVLLRVIDVEGFEDAETKLKAMLNDTTKYPVFESNDEEAMFKIEGISPESLPVEANYYGLNRFFTNFFMDGWNDMKDPRREYFANKGTKNDVVGYYGMESAWTTAPLTSESSHLNTSVVDAPMPLLLMSYAEVEFIRTEMAHRDGNTTDAAEHLEKAITAAIEMWGLEVPADHFSNQDNTYDTTASEADRYESIMTHKFYALIYDGLQQWFEVNRTGIPAIPRGVGMDANNHLPYRMCYPTDCLIYNKANYNSASSNIGGDDYQTELMWHTRAQI